MSTRKKPSDKLKKSAIYLALLLAVAAVLYFLLRNFSTTESGDKAITETVQQKMLSRQTLPENVETAGSAPFEGRPASERREDFEPKSQCRSLEENMAELFGYLDEQEYLADYGLKDGSVAAFREIVSRLSRQTPQISREKKDLFLNMQNTAHFYRVLGPKNLMLLKDYLQHEEGRLAHDFEIFYRWVEFDSCPDQKNVEISMPLSTANEYASFFLTTAGGQSYLYRRTPRISSLVTYYSIRIIDLANERKENKYAVDILPPIRNLLFRLNSENIFPDQDEYLKTLEALKNKYVSLPLK
jgi:hypothetical protein